MKNLRSIIAITLLFAVSISAQGINQNEGASVQFSKSKYISNTSPERNVVLQLNGGTLKAGEIKKLDNNSHWIKNGQFVNRNSTVTIDFNEKLYVNNTPIVEQVDAKNGYIVFFSEGFDYALVYLADANGNLNSDELYINLR